MLKRSARFTALFALVATAVAQAPSSTVRVDTSLVTVDVRVFDTDGRSVSNLTRDDFLILEDGKPKEIRAFSSVNNAQSILMLIDRSISMQEHWPVLEPAIAQLIGTLQPDDRISIGAFDERRKEVQLLLDWQEVRNASRNVKIDPAVRGNPESLSNWSFAGTSSIGQPQSVTYRDDYRIPTKDFYSALQWAVSRLAPVQGTKSGIVFSDGRQPGTPLRTTRLEGQLYTQFVDGTDDNDFKKVLRAIQSSETRFDFVAVNTDLNPLDGRPLNSSYLTMLSTLVSEGLSVRARLEQLASISGGRVEFPVRAEDTAPLYKDIARNRREAYRLGYSLAPGDKVSSQIDIRTKREGLRVRYTLR